MDPILEIAKKHDIRVIEDSAQSIGAEYKDKKSGSIGDLGCFSFFPSKNLGGLGDGGMITCNSDDLEELIYMLRIHGGKPKNYYSIIGINGRLDTIQASVLIKKLGHIEPWCEKRREKASYYTERMKGLDLVTPEIMSFNKHVFSPIRNQDKREGQAYGTLNGKQYRLRSTLSGSPTFTKMPGTSRIQRGRSAGSRRCNERNTVTSNLSGNNKRRTRLRYRHNI